MYLWNFRNKFISNICQLHGRCDLPHSILLPTELFQDEIKWLLFSNPQDREIEKYSYKLERYFSLLGAHQKAYDWLESAEQIFVWGVAFNTYDTELSTLVTHRDFNPVNTFIFNPNPIHKDRALALLTGVQAS